MRKFEIYTSKPMQFREALQYLTDEKIKERGSVCNQTVMDLRDICLYLTEVNEEMHKLITGATAATGIIGTSLLPMPDDNRIDILRATLQDLADIVKMYVVQMLNCNPWEK